MQVHRDFGLSLDLLVGPALIRRFHCWGLASVVEAAATDRDNWGVAEGEWEPLQDRVGNLSRMGVGKVWKVVGTALELGFVAWAAGSLKAMVFGRLKQSAAVSTTEILIGSGCLG